MESSWEGRFSEYFIQIGGVPFSYMEESPKVGVVILNWNGYDDTASCIESFTDVQYDNRFVVVVDNGSSDGSGERLAEEYPECTVLFNEENLGFSGGCNVGIEHCLEKGADYVLLLNNDIEVSPDFLKPLVETAESHEDVAMVGGVVHEGRSDEIWDAGGEFDHFVASHTRYDEIISPTEYQTEFVTCALNLLSEDFLHDNRLDEEFFFGVEEIDLSYQAFSGRWKLFINPNSVAYHDVGSALDHTFSGKQLFSPFQKYHNTRGRLYHAQKNLRSYHMLSYVFLALTVYPAVYAWWAVRHERSDILYAHLLSIYDYFISSEVRKPGFFA